MANSVRRSMRQILNRAFVAGPEFWSLEGKIIHYIGCLFVPVNLHRKQGVFLFHLTTIKETSLLLQPPLFLASELRITQCSLQHRVVCEALGDNYYQIQRAEPC